jgi:predicted flavoprotein YhiN
MSSVRKNERFLYSAFNLFTPQETMAFLKTRRKPEGGEGRKVFPRSDRASDIVDALDRFIKANNVSYKQNRVIRSF